MLIWTAEEDVPTWQATRVIAYTDPDLCRTGLP
jgi:hypothetical protein